MTSAAVKFTDIIPDMVQDAQTLLAQTGTLSPLIVVFDRGGYDSKLFQRLDQMGVPYITWRKWDQPLSPELFTISSLRKKMSRREKNLRFGTMLSAQYQGRSREVWGGSLVEGTLQVTLHSKDLPKYQKVAEKLCRKPKELEPVTLDQNQFPMFYRVAPHE